MKKAKPPLQRVVEAVVGDVFEFEDSESYIRFRMAGHITLAQMNALSIAFGTEAMNFEFGHSDEPDWSEVTPGCAGVPGHVIIFRPFEESEL